MTTETFDALGRLASRTLPNDVTSTWPYDARGWVDSIVHREPAIEGGDVVASVDYTHSVSGEPERIDREDGRSVAGGERLCAYDTSLRVTHGYDRSSAGEVTLAAFRGRQPPVITNGAAEVTSRGFAELARLEFVVP